MSKIHITLVGGQPMPVYNGIKYCKPDKVLFIFSKDSEKQKQTLKKEIINSGLVKDSDVLNSQPLDPVDSEEIEKTVLQYKERFANDEVSINISSGTKAWAYYFSIIFSDSYNSQIYYVDQNNICYNLKTKQQEKIDSDVLLQFKLNKNPLLSYTNFTSYTDTDLAVIEEIEKIRKIDIGIYTELTNLSRGQFTKLEKEQKGKFYTDNKKSYVEWNKSGECKIGIEKKGSVIETELSSPNLTKILFNAAWFELKVANILSKWDKAKNIYMNCKFLVNKQLDKVDQKIAEQNPKNEVDIIIDVGDKALFVECKTAIANSTDIDKFNTVVRNVGGSGSKAIFICLNKIGDKEKEKINDCDMMSYSFTESPDINELYNMLDRKIIRINK